LDNLPPERVKRTPQWESFLSPANPGHNEQEPPLTEASLPPWDMYTVAVALGSGYILIPLLGANVLLLIYPFMSPSGELFAQQGLTLVTWVLIFSGLRLQYGPLVDWLGLRLHAPLRYYLWETIKLLLCTTAITLLLNQFWVLMGQLFPNWTPGLDNPYAHYARQELLMLSVFAVLVAPLLEEVIFRGLVQASFQKVASRRNAILLTCLVFLLFHSNYFDNIRALSLVLVLGLCFGLWRAKTQSIIPSMAAHLCNNLLASIVLLTHQG
jgi:membrane protease YdiL (CAAX protease family)